MYKITTIGDKVYPNIITKIPTAQTWASRVSDYQAKNNQWTITLLSHISLYTTVLVFLHSDQLQSKKYKSIKEEKIQSIKQVSITMKKISQYKVKKRCVVLKLTQAKFP